MARGSIFRRKKDGRPTGYYVIKWKDPEGRWQSKTTRCTNKSLAAAELTAIVGQVNDGTWTPPKNILFRDLCDKWLKKSEAAAKESTLDFYRVQIERRLKPTFGHLQTRAISTELIDLFISELSASTLKAQTVAHTVQVLKSILLTAESWGYVHKSPAAGVKKPRIPVLELEFYDGAEIARLLEAADKRHFPLLLTLALTGLRRSELLGLCWSDVEFDTKGYPVTLNVKYQAQGGRLVDLKTGHSRRRIPIKQRLSKALYDYQLEQAVDGGPKEAWASFLASFLRHHKPCQWCALNRGVSVSRASGRGDHGQEVHSLLAKG